MTKPNVDESSPLAPQRHAIPSSARVWSNQRVCLLGALAVATMSIVTESGAIRFEGAGRPESWLTGSQQVRFTSWSCVGAHGSSRSTSPWACRSGFF